MPRPRLGHRLEDLRTMRRLFLGAEAHARAEGRDLPGAEHLLLAALDLPDDSARVVLAQAGIDAPAPTPRGPFRSQGSLQTAFRRAKDAAADRARRSAT